MGKGTVQDRHDLVSRHAEKRQAANDRTGRPIRTRQLPKVGGIHVDDADIGEAFLQALDEFGAVLNQRQSLCRHTAIKELGCKPRPYFGLIGLALDGGRDRSGGFI